MNLLPKNKGHCFISLFLILIANIVPAQVKLPKLISDGMVLQRDAKVKIWGWASDQEEITINFIDSVYQTSANETGKWEVELYGLKAGGPYSMEIIASNKITLHDILIGDVWVCSGQSQMDLTMNRVSPLYPDEIARAGNSRIRYFSVPTQYDFNARQEDLPNGKWESISRDNILNVSAIAYFFADKLYSVHNVPIGIIRSSLGGSPAQAWISEEAQMEFPEYYKELQQYKDTNLIKQIIKDDRQRINAWYTKLRHEDKGYEVPDKPWYDTEINTSDWSVMDVPGYWADGELGNINGVIWYRKDIEIPAALAGKEARLNLGRIVDSDSVFVNGVFVGSTGYLYPPRRYVVPENLLKEGMNTIVIRVISNEGRGGFVLDKPYELVCDDMKIDLKGAWRYRLGARMEPLQAQTFIRWKPAGLFNGMISPLLGFSIRGVLWYQGESNTWRHEEYRTLFPALINDWRNNWGQGDFPFLFAQLHNFMEPDDFPSESNWALTREAQTMALELPNTAMIVAIDLGEWNDIHPLNKKDVAARYALAAQKVAYHENIVASGPLFQSMKIVDNRVIITFSETGGGLVAKGGGELRYFAIAGSDKKFVWAKAGIENDKVVVWSEMVADPVAVRYAWADNPEGANLYNKEGLPASPFRTDDW